MEGFMHLIIFSVKCENTNSRDGVPTKDRMDLDCHHYSIGAAQCSNSDKHKDEDFEAKKDCCKCGGGSAPKGLKLSNSIISLEPLYL